MRNEKNNGFITPKEEKRGSLADYDFMYTCHQEGCCFFKKWGSPHSVWSNRSPINRLLALRADAIITNYFQALWELTNSVMHHWASSCFIADGFRGPSAHSDVVNKPPSPSPKGSEASEDSFATAGALPWLPCPLGRRSPRLFLKYLFFQKKGVAGLCKYRKYSGALAGLAQ